MREEIVTCDGCGGTITTSSPDGGYSHFELVPIPIDHRGYNFIHANGYRPEDVEQFCYSCKHKMIAALPNAYEFCSICMSKIKVGEMEEHDKEVHPNFTRVTFDVSSDRTFTFTKDQTISKGDSV